MKTQHWLALGAVLSLGATSAFAQRVAPPSARDAGGAIRTDAGGAPGPTADGGAGARPMSGPTTFDLRPGGMSRVTFQSDAPLETMDGVSTDTQGSVTVNVANPAQGLTGRVQVTVASLRTGSDMRDDHMRGANWLDAARNPNIVFEIRRTNLTAALQPGQAMTGTVTGRFSLHGVTRDVTAPVTVRLIPLAAEHASMAQFGVNADMLRVQSEFRINLSDYGVSIMAPLRLKVSNEIRVRVDMTAFRH